VERAEEKNHDGRKLLANNSLTDKHTPFMYFQCQMFFCIQCCSTQTHYPDSKPTSLCSYTLMLRS